LKWQSCFRFKNIRAVLGILALGVALSVIAQEPVHPIVESNVRCLLGGSSRRLWLSADDIVRSISGGERYRLIQPLKLPSTVVTGSKIKSNDAICPATHSVDLSPKPSSSVPTLAVAGDWNPTPRPVQDISSSKSSYATLFQPVLAKLGIAARPDIKQLWKTDLAGDGKDVVVAVMRNFSYSDVNSSHSQANAYSAVVARQLVGSVVNTVVIESENGPREGGVSEYSVPFIVDLNGDAKLEIVVYGRYLQGTFTEVYTLENGKAKKVLSCACGE